MLLSTVFNLAYFFVGIKYGWIVMKIMLCSFLRQYKFTTHLKLEDLVTKWDIVLKLAHGHMVKIEKRGFYPDAY